MIGSLRLCALGLHATQRLGDQFARPGDIELLGWITPAVNLLYCAVQVRQTPLGRSLGGGLVTVSADEIVIERCQQKRAEFALSLYGVFKKIVFDDLVGDEPLKHIFSSVCGESLLKKKMRPKRRTIALEQMRQRLVPTVRVRLTRALHQRPLGGRKSLKFALTLWCHVLRPQHESPEMRVRTDRRSLPTRDRRSKCFLLKWHFASESRCYLYLRKPG